MVPNPHAEILQLLNGCHPHTNEWLLLYLRLSLLSLFQAEIARSLPQILDLYLTRIISRCQLSTRRIRLWIGPQEHNLRASIISSEALAHSIHVGLLPGLFSVPEKDGSSAVIFKGRGQGIKDGKIPLGLTFRSVRMRCETDGPSRLEFQAPKRDYGRISHVAGPSLAPRRNHEQLQQDAGPAHKTTLWRDDVRVHRTGRWWLVPGLALAEAKLLHVSENHNAGYCYEGIIIIAVLGLFLFLFFLLFRCYEM